MSKQRYAMFTFTNDNELVFVNPAHIVMVHNHPDGKDGSRVTLSTGRIIDVDEERNEIVNAITGENLP